MSLPSHLANIKSSGIYRFVWDKSELPPQSAQTMRMVFGYSEKGVFNTPVYIDKASDFTAIYGNASKRLERRGVYFHRLALQALSKGPILAMNLKPFTSEEEDGENYEHVTATSFDFSDLLYSFPSKATEGDGYEVLASGNLYDTPHDIAVKALYDTNRFWTLDADQLPTKIGGDKYVYLTTTDTKASSCSVFMRPIRPKQYDLTIREWYANESSEEMPEYLLPLLDTKLCDYFVEVYVFRGKFSADICKKGGPLGNYITKEMYEAAKTMRQTQWALIGEDVAMTVNDEEDTPKEDAVTDNIPVWNGYFIVPESADGIAELSTIAPDADLPYLNPVYVNAFGELADPLEALANDSASNFVGRYVGCTLPYFKDGNGNYASIDLIFNAGYNNHKMLMKLNEKALEVAEEIENVLNFSRDTDGTSIYKYDENGYYTENYDPTSLALIPSYFEGYEYKTITAKDTGKQLQEKSIGVLKYKGIRTALTNRVDVDYHYIIDTFDTYIGNGIKGELASLAKEKDNAFAILNFPKMESFLHPDDPTLASKFYTTLGDEFGGKVFDIKKIADPKNGFSLVSEVNGASWCAYFTQLVITDGTVKTVFPSAALVSNNFMDKWGPRQPYYIVAGANYGRMSWEGLVGPDYAFGREDLDVLEPMGVNAIVYVPRKGTFINSNQTAKQTPVSALSKIHIRELVIYLQNEIESMLENYHWELNTQALRDTIKSKADTILETVANNGGIYAFENVCDESNNTPEVIDNEMIVLWTSIEPARGAGKMVQELTIHKTGGITSSTR